MKKIFLLICSLVAFTATAQTYPAKPIRFIVPSPPGGGTDTLARLVASKLGADGQWQFFVDNRPGAGGNLGMDAAAKSAPDGYTLVMGESANLLINPALYAKMPFDPAKDLAPVALVGTVPLVLVVSPDKGAGPGQGIDSVGALVAAAKAKKLAFASSGSGTVGHLTAESWKLAAGVDLLHVPYKGAGPAITDVMGGQVDLHFGSLPAVASHVRSGKLRALAVTTPRRIAQLPDVPTLAEAGFKGFDARVVYGVLAPAGTSKEVLAKLNQEINRALQSADLQASLDKAGVEAHPATPEEFGAFLARERPKWARAVKESGARVD
jgi:tripartite-type tricarboxylate transporter receptor subunit TctC